MAYERHPRVFLLKFSEILQMQLIGLVPERQRNTENKEFAFLKENENKNTSGIGNHLILLQIVH